MALRRQQAAKIMRLSLSFNFLDQKFQKSYREVCLRAKVLLKKIKY